MFSFELGSAILRFEFGFFARCEMFTELFLLMALIVSVYSVLGGRPPKGMVFLACVRPGVRYKNRAGEMYYRLDAERCVKMMRDLDGWLIPLCCAEKIDPAEPVVIVV